MSYLIEKRDSLGSLLVACVGLRYAYKADKRSKDNSNSIIEINKVISNSGSQVKMKTGIGDIKNNKIIGQQTNNNMQDIFYNKSILFAGFPLGQEYYTYKRGDKYYCEVPNLGIKSKLCKTPNLAYKDLSIKLSTITG